MRLAGRLDLDDRHMPVGHPDGRKLVSPFDGNDDVRPDSFDLVVLEHTTGLVNQSGRVDNDERRARFTGEIGRGAEKSSGEVG